MRLGTMPASQLRNLVPRCRSYAVRDFDTASSARLRTSFASSSERAYSGSQGPSDPTVGPDGLIYGVRYQPYNGSNVRVFDPSSAAYSTPVLEWVVQEGVVAGFLG